MKKTIPSIFLILLASCSSDSENIPPEPDGSRHSIGCCQAVVTKGEKIEKPQNTQARGWEVPTSDLYPFSSVYVISDAEDDDDDDYETIKDKDRVSIPVNKSPEITYVDMCFQYGPGANPDKDDDDDDDVFITVDGQTIEIDDCLFSSTSDAKGDMTLSSSISTPGGEPVYEPYGDKLFFSDFFEAEYEHKKLTLEFKERDEFGNEHKKEIPIKSGEPITIPLKRYTAVIDSKVFITHLNGHSHTLSYDEFQTIFGDTANWSVRVFLNNAPTSFNYTQMYNYPKGNDIIALSQEQLPFTTGLTNNDPQASPRDCEGVGADDHSNPHIFPMNTSKWHKSEICYSFYYTGDKSIPIKGRFGRVTMKKILPQTTIRIPLDYEHSNITTINANTKYILTHLIDVEDFKKGVTGTYDQSKSSRGQTVDPIFGHVADIPYEQQIAVQKGI